MDDNQKLPEPRWWAEKITQEMFDEFAPRNLELVDGNILADENARLRLLLYCSKSFE